MRSQKGFSVVEAIILVVVIAFLGLAVWFVVDKNREDSVPTDNNQVTAQTEEYSAPEGWEAYAGNGFKFIYPEDFKNLSSPDLDFANFVTVQSSDGFQVGGGFGPKLSYSSKDKNWYISQLGPFSGNEKVGDVLELYNSKSNSGITVYNYTQGDGPFSQTELLFVSGNKMVRINLPNVCSKDDGCTPASRYTSEEITEITQQISKSVEYKIN